MEALPVPASPSWEEAKGRAEVQAGQRLPYVSEAKRYVKNRGGMALVDKLAWMPVMRTTAGLPAAQRADMLLIGQPPPGVAPPATIGAAAGL